MKIITNEHLKKKISDYNLTPLEVSVLKISNQVYLKIDTIDDFLKFASDSKLEFVYFYYTYYKSEKYIIPQDWYSDYSKEFKAVVVQHNRYIESLNFDSPKSLVLFIIQNDTLIGTELQNPWIEDKNITVAEEAIEVIDYEFHEVQKKRDLEKGQQKEDEKKLREIIFEDPEFRYCKNQELRYWYLVELLEREDIKQFEYLVEPYGIPHTGKIKVFMDMTWALYREQKKQM
ncbi:hypothetical protein [Dethiobacter alkaliphilus]|uniref:Uncharacterized protein n=1 Tax=Dethiobacter alkaliphilus AHT 1 TaxID=555088 RepID=C0GE66_DETAL|nr:hypothetical protein [Dethiobacter alkaliphilus]EEG78360.1 hypothetical protein DealDRAFT_0775 [Dethiobacter alkaliphilus AHT 1]